LIEKEHNGNVAMFRHDSSSPARKAKQKKKEKKKKQSIFHFGSNEPKEHDHP
jgi:hypothetical protein